MAQSLIFIDDPQLKAKINQLKNAVIVDIRSSDEYQREHIPNSVNLTVEQLKQTDLNQWQDKTVIFHCKLGHRTKQAQTIIEKFNCQAKYCLAEGIEQWKRCGLSTIKNDKAPLELVRQVHIVAGSLILLSLLLTYFVSLYFIGLTALVGFGLTFAGLTGFCGMAKLLQKLPYNKRR